ncbi:MAG: hypothetical protein GY803_04960, partial [Chloroflexi bacterium]|nr:hypothetical protein [Chloroflexota bacterium]
LNIPGARIVVHGFPWREIAMSARIKTQPNIVVTNGPPVTEATTILVSAPPADTQRLAHRFFPGNDLMLENLHLLRPGEGVVLSENTAILVAWGQAAKGLDRQQPEKEQNP